MSPTCFAAYAAPSTPEVREPLAELPTPAEVSNSFAKQSASEVFRASRSMWELAREQKQSRSKGPGNNLPPISRLPGCRCAQHSLFLPRLEESGFISTGPHLFHEGPMPPSRACPGLGRWHSWLRSHTSSLTPHRPQRFPLNQAFDIPIKEAPFTTAGSRGPAPPRSARKARDEPNPREEGTESHRPLLGVALAGQLGRQPQSLPSVACRRGAQHAEGYARLKATTAQGWATKMCPLNKDSQPTWQRM